MAIKDYLIRESEKREKRERNETTLREDLGGRSSAVDVEALASVLSAAVDISSAQKLYKQLGSKLNGSESQDKNKRKLFLSARRRLEQEYGTEVRGQDLNSYMDRDHFTVQKKFDVVSSPFGGLQLVWVNTHGEPVAAGSILSVLVDYTRKLKMYIASVRANKNAGKREIQLADEAEAELSRLKAMLRQVMSSL